MTDRQLERMLEQFVEKNPYVADLLGADVGVRLMNTDSRIAEIVLNTFTAEEVPVLCIHDSFIIDYTRAGQLKQAMTAASEQVVGRALPVKATTAGLDEIKQGQNAPDYIGSGLHLVDASTAVPGLPFPVEGVGEGAVTTDCRYLHNPSSLYPPFVIYLQTSPPPPITYT